MPWVASVVFITLVESIQNTYVKMVCSNNPECDKLYLVLPVFVVEKMLLIKKIQVSILQK